MRFIQSALDPRRFLAKPAEFDALRAWANELLAFRGWHLHPDGKFGRVQKAATIEEAKVRAGRLRGGVGAPVRSSGCSDLLPGGTLAGKLLPRCFGGNEERLGKD